MNFRVRKTVKHFNTAGHAHELTFSCYRRHDYLSDPVACELLCAELTRCREEHGFQLWAYVFMPNHVHLLILPQSARHDVARILNDLKGRMATRYREHVMRSQVCRLESFMMFDTSKKRDVFRFWQVGGGFDRNLWTAEAIHRAIEYIEANPVRRGLVNRPGEFHWSSAYAHEQATGLVPDRLNVPMHMLDGWRQSI